MRWVIVSCTGRYDSNQTPQSDCVAAEAPRHLVIYHHYNLSQIVESDHVSYKLYITNMKSPLWQKNIFNYTKNIYVQEPWKADRSLRE